MMPDGMPSWEEWNEQLDDGQRQYYLYKTMVSIEAGCIQRQEACNTRFKTLENRKWFNRTAAFIGGAIGGFLTTIGFKG